MKLGTSLIPAYLFSLAIGLTSCGEKPSETTGTKTVEVAAEPTKVAAIALLSDFAKNLESGDSEAAAVLMKTPPGMSETEKTESMSSFLERKEISSAGVAILTEKGSWGKLTEVFPERGARLAEKWELDAGECWGLGYEGAQAGFHWDGEKFLLIRCDDIGKLQ